MSDGLGSFQPHGSFGGGLPAPQGDVVPQAPQLDDDILAGSVVPRDDGGVDIVLEQDEPPDVLHLPHDANLAEVLNRTNVQELNRIAELVIEGFEADCDSNRGVYDVFERGLKLLALKPGERAGEGSNERFDGASMSVDTLLLEAVVRFAAEASGELIPAAGPAKCQVIGDDSPDKESAASRKADFLNYYLTESDAGYVVDFDRMLPQIGLYGTMYRKVWRDPLRGGAVSSRYLSPYDFVTAATTMELNGTDRATHVEPLSGDDIIRLQIKSWFANVDLGEPADDALDWKPRQDFRTPSDRPEDVEHVILHQYVCLDLAGFEHVDDDGVPTGLPLPYIVSVDRETHKVLRLVRDWNEGDGEFRRRQSVVPYDYMPGLGAIGWGLINLVGARTDDLSIMLRQALDSFTFASFPGGLRVRGTKAEQGDMSIGPGEWAEIETNGQPIGQAVMPLPYKDVPPSYPIIVQDLKAAGQRLASVGDAAVGDGREDALPGTVIALITQATKLQSSVIKRLHRAQRAELRMIADLFGKDQDAVYPYTINGRRGKAVAADFADNDDVLPVADPNVPTQQHRLQLAQGVWQMAKSSPGMFDMREATVDYLRALGRTDADIARLMPPPNQGKPADPVTEFAMVLKGAPLAVGPAQDHAAHIQAHMTQMSAPGVGATPAGPQLVAHMADHMAWFYRNLVAATTGIQVQLGQPMPQQIENQIAAAVAKASQQMQTELAKIIPQGGNAMQMMEMQLKNKELDLKNEDSERKAEASARAEQSEFLRQKITVENDKATRAAEILTGLMDLEAARLKATGDVGKATVETVGQQTEALAGVAVAQHEAQGERHRAAASVHQASTGLAGQHLQSTADVITAMGEKAVAEAQRDAAIAQSNQKGTE